MRRAFAKSLAPAGLVVLSALLTAGGAFSEDAHSGVVQIATAAITSEQPAVKNLNSVPLDGLEDANGIESSRLVRQLTAARPNEDLVICIAGCFSGRDRVVYAQPIDQSAQAAKSASVSILNGASDGSSGEIIRSLRASQ